MGYSKTSYILHSTPRTSCNRLNSDIHGKLLTEKHPFSSVIISLKGVDSISDRSITKARIFKSGEIIFRNTSCMTVKIITKKLFLRISSPIELKAPKLIRNETFLSNFNLGIKVLNMNRLVILISDSDLRPPNIDEIIWRVSFSLNINILLTKEVLEDIIDLTDFLVSRIRNRSC